MKKLVTILLLSLFSYCQIGHYLTISVYDHLQQEKMEEQVLSTVPLSYCEKFDLLRTGKEITWSDDGKMFFLNGTMYDVVKASVDRNGVASVYGIKESTEQRIIHDMTLKICPASEQSIYLFGFVLADDFMLPHQEYEAILPSINAIFSTFTQSPAEGCKDVLLCPPRNNA